MRLAHRLTMQAPRAMQTQRARLATAQSDLQHATAMRLAAQHQRLEALAARLHALDPSQVLARGYAWLSDAAGTPVMSVRQLSVGSALRAVLNDGAAEVQVTRLDV
jgi:exodeoxyribonuclease VII large subunit